MTELPEPILELAALSNEEHPIYKSDNALLRELIIKVNQLLVYLKEKEEKQ